MSSMPTLLGRAALLLALLALVGCDERGSGDGGVPTDGELPADGSVGDAGPGPVTLYTPVDLPDDVLADQAVRILAGTLEQPRCPTCHGLTPVAVRTWADQTTSALDCIGTLDPNVPDEARAIIACFSTDRVGNPALLGLVSTAVRLEWFTRVFDIYYPMTSAPEQAEFSTTAHMPQGTVAPLTQEEVDVLLSWSVRGLPGLDTRLDPDGGVLCLPEIGPRVAAHVTAMETEGWAVRNASAGITMHGCAAGQVGADCLSTYPTETNGWTVTGAGNLRVLFEYDYHSSYWTRSSADGRFVGHGGSPDRRASAAVIDLERGVVIPADALYDPGFFPDNSGFMFQGTAGGGSFCEQSLLNSNPTWITFGETECVSSTTVGLYQHMAAVAGGDYWTVFGQFVSDDGGQSERTSALPVEFDGMSNISLVPLVFDGSAYVPGSRIRVPAPFEGDTVISPSGRLLISRTRAIDGSQSGYVLRALDATPSGDTYTVDTPIIASYCGRAAKPGFSYDERFITYHRYVLATDAIELGFTGPDDPAFAPYLSSGAANVFIRDLATGAEQRITNMGPGEYALFPHYRSDGWVYFTVRAWVAGATNEYVVASDASFAM